MHSLRERILWDKRSKTSNSLVIIGLALGTAILLFALQSIFDFGESRTGTKEDRILLTLNKKVNLLNSLGAKSQFREKELSEIEAIEGIDKVAVYKSNDFKLQAASSYLNFKTELFFEALPDDFLESIDVDFHWTPNSKFVPIILPKDYIALYNFGFAPSQGLPQISPDLIQRFGFDLFVFGGGIQGTFEGKIVGLNDQINTVLVPQSFLVWANKKYGNNNAAIASRLGVLVDPSHQSMIIDELEDEGYEINTSHLLDGKTRRLVQLSFLLLAVIGAFISALAFFLARQNQQLLVQNAKPNIQRLFLFGQPLKDILSVFQPTMSRILLVGVGAGLILFLSGNWGIKSWLNTQGFFLNPLPHWIVLFAAIMASGIFYYLQKKKLVKQLSSFFN